MTTPRVVAFVGGGLGDSALQAVKDHLVAIVVSENPERFAECLTWDRATAEILREYQPTHGVCAGYRRIIPQDIIDVFPHGIANVHTSLLPYGRGAHPNAWAIEGRFPAGVSIHLIDRGVDTGPLLAQRGVEKLGHDTAKTLYARLVDAAMDLMGEVFPKFLGGYAIPYPQPPGIEVGPTRRKADLETLTLHAEDCWYVDSVIDLLRARTFPPFPGALYVDADGNRYRIRIEIEPDKG